MCCFLTSFFRVWASILEPLGPPSWSQVGSKSKNHSTCLPLWTLLSQRSFQNGVLEGSWVDFGAPWARFLSLRASILRPPGLDFEAPGSIVEPPGLLPCFGYASHNQQHNVTNVGWISCLGFLPFLLLPSSKALPNLGGGGVPPWGPSME